MKRRRLPFIAAVLISLAAGCDSGGIDEGMPDEENVSPQPPGFAEMMKKDAKNMQLKNARPKGAAAKQ